MQYRNDIQGLRGISVLFVLFYHLYPKLLSGGFIGVDIFFVISGFLVCHSIETRLYNQKYLFYISFYSARIRRLLPSSLLTIFVVAVYVYIYDYTYFYSFKNDAVASIFIFANYHFYYSKVDYFHSGLKESLLLHYWSLSLEEQFYIIIPILVHLFYNSLLKLYILISFISLFTCLYYSYYYTLKGYYFLFSRSWEFVIGALVKYIPYNEKNILKFKSEIIIYLLIFISIYYDDKISYPGSYAIFPVLLSAYIVYSFDKTNMMFLGLICIIGNCSYSLYLVHFPLKNIIYKSKFLYYFALLLITNIYYNYIEIPFHKGKLVLSNKLTYYFFPLLAVLLYVVLINLNKKISNRLNKIKHFTSLELSLEFQMIQRSFCCMNDNSKIYKSSVLFIGDSHIQQYIFGLIKSKYKITYHLISLFITANSHYSTMVEKYIKLYSNKYRFNLCIFGNIIKEEYIAASIYNMSVRVLSFCEKVLLNNDNPRHSNDPNSCLKENKNDCYGLLNITCFIPKSFAKPNNSNIFIISFWDEKMVRNNKCFYYYNYLPLYADNNHLSLYYLKIISCRINYIISKYITNDINYKYNSNCNYYIIPKSNFYVVNTKNEKCR